MDPDLNKYDVEHVCTAHSRMTDKDWQDIYHEAWSLYYTPEHTKTLLRRAMATGVPIGNLAKYLLTFSTTDRLERYIPSKAGSSASSIRPSAGRACRARSLGSSGRALAGRPL